jgi:hypothetical protein
MSARRAAQELWATTAISMIFPHSIAAQTSAQAVSSKRAYSMPRQSLDRRSSNAVMQTFQEIHGSNQVHLYLHK